MHSIMANFNLGKDVGIKIEIKYRAAHMLPNFFSYTELKECAVTALL